MQWKMQLQKILKKKNSFLYKNIDFFAKIFMIKSEKAFFFNL